eukprot:426436_1
MEIAFVIYRATIGSTEIKEHPFKSSGNFKSNIIPSREPTPLDAKSVEPIDIHGALHKALKFGWKPSAEKRTLILIAKNPPHGIQYHELGRDADLYPEGVKYPTNEVILNAIAREKIHLFIINIDNALDYFCKELVNTTHHKGIARKWVKCIKVENKNDLTHKLLDCIVGIQDPGDSKSNEDPPPVNDEHKDRPHDLVGKMRWIKTPVERGGTCYPVLVLSVNKETVFIWDGESSRNIELIYLCQRSDLVGDAKGLRKSDKGVKVLLKRSHAMQQTLSEERHQCKEQSEKSKASTQNKTKQIEELIHGKISAHDNIKWMQKKDGGYQPVHVIQQGDLYSQHSKSFVLNMYNETLAIKSTSLYDRPPYGTAQHIANHVEQLDRLCANYPWKRAVKCGTTQCSW